MTPTEEPTRPSGWSTAGLIAVAALAALDAVLGPENNLSGSFGVAPFVTAVGAHPAATGLVGVLALFVSGLTALADHVPAEVALVRMGIVAVAGIAATAAAGRRRTGETRLRKVARVADVAQRAILEPLPQEIDGYHLAATYVSATEEASVGGDLYALVRRAHGARLLLGDVRGKGLEAVQLAAAAMRTFHAAALTTERLEELPRAFEEALLLRLGPEDFLTCLMVELGADHTVAVANCGHPPPLLLSRGGTASLDPPTPVPPVGLGASGLVTRVALRPGERLLLYTDGLVEARDTTGSFIRPEEILAGIDDHDLGDVADEVVRRLEERTGGRIRDDLALVLIESTGDRPREREHDLVAGQEGARLPSAGP